MPRLPHIDEPVVCVRTEGDIPVPSRFRSWGRPFGKVIDPKKEVSSRVIGDFPIGVDPPGILGHGHYRVLAVSPGEIADVLQPTVPPSGHALPGTPHGLAQTPNLEGIAGQPYFPDDLRSQFLGCLKVIITTDHGLLPVIGSDQEPPGQNKDDGDNKK
jgi:hypothetical protein